MRRIFPLLALAFGCTESRYVSNFRMPHGGECPSDTGCEAAPNEPRFEAPDSNHVQAEPTVPQVVNAKKPEPTCELVGTQLAALELGNYAEDDQVRTTVDKYAERCRNLGLTRDERACILAGNGDAAAQAYCAPRLFPSVPMRIVTAGECTELVSTVRAKMQQSQLTGPQLNVWNAKMSVFAASCASDRWTMELATCTKANAYVEEPLMSCMRVAPMALQAKINERLQQAMKELTGAR